jgi:hypothetical protein
MRYPILAFLFVFLLVPYTAHAVLSGSAGFHRQAGASTVATAQYAGTVPTMVRTRLH